ncbi:hypothetical protein BGZ94_003895, partial [Podila epigama]
MQSTLTRPFFRHRALSQCLYKSCGGQAPTLSSQASWVRLTGRPTHARAYSTRETGQQQQQQQSINSPTVEKIGRANNLGQQQKQQSRSIVGVHTIPPALSNRTIKNILASTEPNTVVKVQGWIRSTRQQKHVTFMEVNDGSSLKGVQAILEGGQGKGLGAGTSVELEGMLVKSLGKGQAMELQVSKLKVIGACDGETYPLQKKRHSFEFLREISHLRSRAKTASAILRLRSASAWGFQKFFE